VSIGCSVRSDFAPRRRGAAEAGHGGQLAVAHHLARRDLYITR